MISDGRAPCPQFPNSRRAFLVVEGERELGVTASLYEAAILWKENPDARTVFQVTPPDGSGAGRWERTSGVLIDALRADCRAKGLGVQSWRTIQLLKTDKEIQT